MVVFHCLASLGFASTAGAVIDPDPDMVGVYFDMNADIYCTTAPVGAPFDAYLMFTNISCPAGLYGWEANVEITAGVYVLAWTLTGSAINASSPPDFAVGLASPLPWQPAIMVLTMTVGVFAPGAIEFMLHPANLSSFTPPLPGYAAGDDPGDLRSCGYSAGPDEGLVCAVINGDCQVVDSEDATWGSVKALYK